MSDLPDYQSWVEAVYLLAGSLEHGADANKSADPDDGDVYLATDTERLYVCHTDGVWTQIAKPVWKDTPTEALDSNNRTSTLDWTDLDLTAHTSANAHLAMLEVVIKTDSYTDGNIYVGIRKNGTTPSYYPLLLGDIQNTGFMSTRTKYPIIGLDTGQVIEYTIVVSGTAQVDTNIRVLGYVE